jgi:hypothetical protein
VAVIEGSNPRCVLSPPGQGEGWCLIYVGRRIARAVRPERRDGEQSKLRCPDSKVAHPLLALPVVSLLLCRSVPDVLV